jgi:hypothetical protein
MIALFFYFGCRWTQLTGIPIDAGIVGYEITDVNSVLVFWNVLCLKIFNWALFQLSFEKIGQF